MFVKLRSAGPDKYGMWTVLAEHMSVSFSGEGSSEDEARENACSGIARVCGVMVDEVVVVGGMKRTKEEKVVA